MHLFVQENNLLCIIRTFLWLMNCSLLVKSNESDCFFYKEREERWKAIRSFKRANRSWRSFVKERREQFPLLQRARRAMYCTVYTSRAIHSFVLGRTRRKSGGKERIWSSFSLTPTLKKSESLLRSLLFHSFKKSDGSDSFPSRKSEFPTLPNPHNFCTVAGNKHNFCLTGTFFFILLYLTLF